MKWLDYREKLGISFSDEEKFRMFTNRIENLFGINDSSYVLRPEEMFYFCNTVGFPFSMVGGYTTFYYMDKALLVLSQYTGKYLTIFLNL